MLVSSSCSSYFMGCSGNSIPKLTMRNCAYAFGPDWWGQNGCILRTVSERISGDAHSSGYRGTGEKQTRCLLCMVVQIGGIHHAPAFGKYVWTERQLACFEQILLSSSNFSASLPPSVHLPSSSPLRTCQDSCCMTINQCGWRLVHGGGEECCVFLPSPIAQQDKRPHNLRRLKNERPPPLHIPPPNPEEEEQPTGGLSIFEPPDLAHILTCSE